MDQDVPAEQTQREDEHKLILVSRVLKTHVYNREGDHIGHVDDLSIERATGQAQYAIVSFGGFLGIGERYHPLPWSALEYDPARGGFVVALDKSALVDAPTYDRAQLAALGGESHEQNREMISEYYGRFGLFPY